MSKFNMDFEYNDSKTEEITEATNVDAMDCAMIAAECSAILVNYQKIQLEAYTNADGNEELYNSEIAIVSEGFFADMWKKIKDFLMKIVDMISKALHTFWNKLKELFNKAKVAVLKFVKDHKPTKESYYTLMFEADGVPGKTLLMSYPDIVEVVDSTLSEIGYLKSMIRKAYEGNYMYDHKFDPKKDSFLLDDDVKFDSNGNMRYPKARELVNMLYKNRVDDLHLLDDAFVTRASAWLEARADEYSRKISVLCDEMEGIKANIRESSKQLSGQFDTREAQENIKYNTNVMLSSINWLGTMFLAAGVVADDTTKAILSYCKQ